MGKERYVEVPAETLEAFLAGKGFERTEHHREVVYVRRHHVDSRYRILIYTSIRVGASKARKKGADAIRVCATFTPTDVRAPTRGVAKLPRVYRTGTVEGVLDRVMVRAREAYTVCNRHVRAKMGGINPGG